MKRKRVARRVQPWRPEQPFCCPMHREQAHLEEIMHNHPVPIIRGCAKAIYGELAWISNGKYGGVELDSLFD